MTLVECIALMTQHAQALQTLAADVSAQQSRWKPDAASWSILEVVNHLYDEEREDFRPKLAYILDRAQPPPPPIDPQGWVTARAYLQRDLAPSLANFMREREASLAWLRTLEGADFASFIEAPFGQISAGDMLAAWVAHDMLHVRQLNELRYAYFKRQAAPYAVDYAGEW